MLFTYTFRDRNGRLQTGEIESDSRNDAFARLKEQKVSVLSLTQGRRTVAGEKRGPVSLGKSIAILAAVGLLLIGLVICFWSSSEKPEDAKNRIPAVKTEKPAHKVATRPKVKPARPVSGGVKEKAEMLTNAVPTESPVPPGHIRLPTGLQLRYHLPPEGKTRKLIAGGEIWEIDHEGNAKNITPPPLFRKPFEQTLSSLAHRDGIVLQDVIARYSKEDILKWCAEPTEYFDDDTQEDLKKRQTVAEMKSMVSDYIKAGGEFKEFVQQVQAFSEKERRFQANGLSEITKAMQEGRTEDARLLVSAMNKLSDEKGYSRLMIPARYKDLLTPPEAPQK